MRRTCLVMLVAVVLTGCGGGRGEQVAVDRQATYAVYFLTEGSDTCDVVTRVVPDGRPVHDLRSALEALLAGPDGDDDDGATASMFTARTAGSLRDVSVHDGTAYVDFEDFSDVIPNASSSCGSRALLAQLDATIRQFPGVDRGVYSFGDDRAAFYEWLQLAVPEEG